MSFVPLFLMPVFAYSMTFEQASVNLRNEVSNYAIDFQAKELCDKYTCCKAESGDACNISSMPKDTTTLYLPGGESRCINSDSTPYAAQVIPGDKDKLLVFFQGGGACWNEGSTKLGFCTQDSSPSSLNGIFDRTNPQNAHASYTVVQMLYCSGDIFGGNTTRAYNDSQGEPIVQVGLTNVQLTLDWIVQQQKSGELASTLTDLVVAGCSAGSIGAQLWGNQVANALSWKSASIMPDSYAGVFAPGVEGPLVKSFGFCDSGFLNDANYKKCMDEQITLKDIDLQFISDAPSIAYSFIQSKTDMVQQSFYVATAASMGVPALQTPSEFYADVNEIFGAYNVHDNFVAYLVNGNQHCFTPSSVYYSADAAGPKDNGENASPMMVDWVGQHIPLHYGETISTVCDGEITSDNEGKTYCSDSVVPKSYVEKY